MEFNAVEQQRKAAIVLTLHSDIMIIMSSIGSFFIVEYIVEKEI
jgi:hypothetical protein